MCAHLSDVKSSYGDLDRALQQLRILGIRHVRDDVRGGFGRQEQILQAAHARGINTTLIVNPQRFPLNNQNLQWLKANRNALDAVEGPNEIDNTHAPMDFEAEGRKLYEGTISYQAALSTALRQQGMDLPMLSFTIVRDNFAPKVAQLVEAKPSIPFDYESVHLYDKSGQGPAIALSDQMAALRHVRSRPFIISETGYTTVKWSPGNDRIGGRLGVSERVQAIYLARTLLDSYALGARRTFLYQLQDGRADPGSMNKEEHFGVFDVDGRAKPAAVYLAALLSTLRQALEANTGVSRPASDRMTVQPMSNVRTLRLTGGQAGEVLVVWRTDTLWNPTMHAESPNSFGSQDVHIRWGSKASRRLVVRDVAAPRSYEVRVEGSDKRLDLGPTPLIVMSYPE